MPFSAAKPASLALLVVAALVLAACGGEDAPTKEEFIAEGDAICREGDEALNTAAEEQFGDLSADPPRKQQEQFVSEVVAAEYRSQLEQLRELTPPEGDEEEVDAILTSLEQLADQAESDPGSLLDAQTAPEAARLAAEYGFMSCGA